MNASFDDRFDELFRTGYRAAYAILGIKSEADDCAQEALVRAISRWRSIEPYANAWVVRVAANQALDRNKRQPRHTQATALGSATDTVDQRAEVVWALRQLPVRQREAVVLRYLADLSEADAANAMGCSIGTVKSSASRGLVRLRIQLRQPEEATQ